MKVLKIIHTMGHGGAENVFRWLAWGLIQEGIDVVAGIPLNNDPSNKENWITPALEELNIPYETFDKTGSPFNLLSNIRSLVKKVSPDIVHSHLLDSNFYSSLACRWLWIPHVCTEHGDVALKRSLTSRFKFKVVSALSGSIICVSEAVRKKALRMAVFPHKVSLIYNGIMFHNDDDYSTFREEFGIPGNALLIGSVGNLYPVKGHQYLIKAFSRFLTHYPKSYLVLVGRGEEERKLKNLAFNLNIPEGKIVFTGFRKDVGNVLISLDIYVQSSLSEGHPVSLLEAMSLGVPVISTCVGGVPEVIGHNKYGSLVPPESWEDLYRYMVMIAQDIEMFKKKAMLAKTFVKKAFSLNRMTQKYIELYERILAG